MTHSETCPEIERLAALADGRVSNEERDVLLRHVNRCEDCYEILVDTLKYASSVSALPASDTSARSPALDRPWKWAAGLAIAAGILLVLLIPVTTLILWPSEPPLTAAALSDALQLESQGDLLAAQLIDNLDAGRGFAADSDAGRIAFRLGVRQMDLAVARSAGAEIWLDRILREMERTLEVAPRFSTQIRLVQETRRGLSAGALSPTEVAALEEGLAAVQPDFFSLGLWAESGRLAAANQTMSLLESQAFSEGLVLATRLELPPTATAEVTRIQALSESEVQGKEAWESLEKSFSDLIQLLL